VVTGAESDRKAACRSPGPRLPRRRARLGATRERSDRGGRVVRRRGRAGVRPASFQAILRANASVSSDRVDRGTCNRHGEWRFRWNQRGCRVGLLQRTSFSWCGACLGSGWIHEPQTSHAACGRSLGGDRGDHLRIPASGASGGYSEQQDPVGSARFGTSRVAASHSSATDARRAQARSTTVARRARRPRTFDHQSPSRRMLAFCAHVGGEPRQSRPQLPRSSVAD
jgi:hypothetical protein